MPIDPLNSDNLPKAPLRSGSKGSNPGLPSDSAVSQPNRRNLLLNKLSMSDWDVDPLKVYKVLTNKELSVDEHSRLVSESR